MDRRSRGGSFSEAHSEPRQPLLGLDRQLSKVPGPFGIALLLGELRQLLTECNIPSKLNQGTVDFVRS